MKSLATSVMAIAAMTSTAFAADLGGNCCSDLEERVAELEATTAKKGTRKVSVEVYGQVSKVILWSDSKYGGVTDNASNSPSRFGLRGTAKINADWTAGYNIEFGLNDPGKSPIAVDLGAGPVTLPTSVVYTTNNGVTVRQNNWWIESKTFGRVTAGHLSAATDGLAQISLANTGSIVDGSTGFANGRRYDGVRYDTPTIAGAVTLSGSYANDQSGQGADLAARYAQQFGDLRVAGGIGYTRSTGALNNLCTYSLGACTVLETWFPSTMKQQAVFGSASIMSVANGLFLNAMVGQATNEDPLTTIKTTGTTYHLTGGVEKNWFGIGNTTIYAEYAKAPTLMSLDAAWDGNANRNNWYGVGVVQSVDAAAMDLFIGLRRTEDNADITGAKATGVQVLSGGRIRF